MKRMALIGAAAASLLGIESTLACPYHIVEPASSSSDAFAASLDSAVSSPYAMQALLDSQLASAASPAEVVLSPAITVWKQNTTGLVGSSSVTAMNAYVSQIPADVQWVAYNSTSAYVRASGVPSHSVGPFGDGNPSYPSNRNRTFRIPLNPQPQAGTHTATGLGAIGVLVNGVPIYNASDNRSYNNANVWHQNANVAEAAGFDTGPGHPSPIMGTSNPVQGAYHYHQSSSALLNQIDPGNTGQHHSPLLGYAFDGYPIYGPYGYANADGTGGIERIESSYRMRNITQRTVLADGTDVADGPAVGGQYPLGYYLEDFEFVSGLGDLDQYNGRLTVTPEYPQGTYAYFATLDSTGKAFYPYFVGPNYYGQVATENTIANGTGVTVPGDAQLYIVPEPGSLTLLATGALFAVNSRQRKLQRISKEH
jgi:hypothetical protein